MRSPSRQAACAAMACSLHHRRIFRDSLVGERRRHQLAALAMLFAFAVEESVAQQRARKRLQDGAFLEIVRPFDQDFRDQFRRVDEDHVDASESRAADAGDVRAQPFKHVDAVGEQRADGLDETGH